MRRLSLFASAAIACLSFGGSVHASSDTTCISSWKIGHTDLSGCDNMALLGPGNDTRVNMLFLLMDKYPDHYKFAGYDQKMSEYDTPADISGNSLFEWGRLDRSFFAQQTDEPANNYYGSICVSNVSGKTAFESAVTASKTSAVEKKALISARQALDPQCSQAVGLGAIDAATQIITSAVGSGFVAYLKGAASFYDSDFGAANSYFIEAGRAESGWLKEASAYMLGRTQLNRAQASAFGEWGDLKPEAADRSALVGAETLLKAYLKAYPGGQYATSARGLMRRVYWLGGNREKLASEYMALFADPSARPRDLDDGELIQEVDNKLLPGLDKNPDVTDPIILAVIDLQRMRASASDGEWGIKPLGAAELQAQKRYFGGNPDLYSYLQASHAFFVGKKPADVLKLIPDAARQEKFSYLQFSRQVLRGMALDAVKDRNARGFWLEMMSGAKQPYQRAALDLALASNLERNNAVAQVFDPSTQITDPAVRQILLQYSAGSALLKQQANDSKASKQERDVALFTLLYKQLTRGNYADFAAQAKALPANAPTEQNIYYELREANPVPIGLFRGGASKSGYICPSISQTAMTLSTAPKNSTALLCLGDFVRNNNFDAFTVDARPEKDELGGFANLYTGTVFARLDTYKALIASPATPANDKAYALYRAVNCYAPSGYNSCNGGEVDVSVRKAWFNQLKKNYPQTAWAKSLKYYW